MCTAREQGSNAERRAERWLQAQGLLPIARNHRCRHGEIDLIMQDADTMVFIEVRLRRNRSFGGALASVDHRKQQRLIQAAGHYLQRHPWNGPCRFDVLGMDGRGEPEWIRDAFGAG